MIETQHTSTPVYPDVAIQSNESAAAASGINACPFCTGTTTILDNRDHIGWQAFCLLCHARGPVADTRDEGIERWNLAAAASRDASLIAFVDDLLDQLQDRAGMSAEWCEAEMRTFEALLREG